MAETAIESGEGFFFCGEEDHEEKKMAEASVETSTVSPRFFCHRCNDEIERVLPGFKCPRCNSGFIEELELLPQNSFSDESSDGDDVEMVTSIGELLSQSIFTSLRDSTASADSGNGASPAPTDSGGNGTSRRRRQAHQAFALPVRSTRRRTSSDRQMPPLENIIQEFIINLSGFDWDPSVMQAQGSPMLMYGNPGDYAFGRAGLDAIITQLLNQMDGTGPPPMAKDKIAEIPTVTIDQSQIDGNMQCSVCWEDFKLAEPVRKLVCEHYYHTQCIVPWLQLHGTCPICRKALADETVGDGSSASVNASAGPSTSSSSASPASSSTTNNTSWLSTASQSGPRIISSFLGSITNALSGGGGGGSSSSGAGSSTLTPGPSPSGTASLQRGGSSSASAAEPGEDASSQRHQYNLRSRDNRPDNVDDDDSVQPLRFGRGRGRFQYFEEDYD